jgi:hypothetical protein
VTPAKFLGYVEAPDDKAAVQAAAKEFNVAERCGDRLADAAAASSGEYRFEIEAQLLRRLVQDLPGRSRRPRRAAG